MKSTITIGAEPSVAYQKSKFEITVEIEYTDMEDFKRQSKEYQEVVRELAAQEVKNIRMSVNSVPK